MVIDMDERCASLGIDPAVLDSAQDKLFDAVAFKWAEGGEFDHFDELPEVLTDEEIVAYVRWNNLHKGFPEYFTWDGWLFDYQSE